MSNPAIDAIVETLSNRISDESFDFAEAAQAIMDALHLRQEWSYREANGAVGFDYNDREQAVSEIEGLGLNATVVYRVASDWNPE